MLEHFVELKLLISKEWEGRAKEAGLVGYLVSLGGVNLALRDLKWPLKLFRTTIEPKLMSLFAS